MGIKMAKAELTKQLGIPTLEIVFAHVAHIMRFMQSETGHHGLHSNFLLESCGADFSSGGRDLFQHQSHALHFPGRLLITHHQRKLSWRKSPREESTDGLVAHHATMSGLTFSTVSLAACS